MRKLIAVWLLAALAVGACASASTSNTTKRAEPSAFELVCAKSLQTYGTGCDDIDAPAIIFTDLVRVLEAYGAHIPGEPQIFIRPGLSVHRTYMLIVHETVHYVLYQLDIQMDMCRSEAIARNWTADITNTIVDPDWRRRYRCKRG